MKQGTKQSIIQVTGMLVMALVASHAFAQSGDYKIGFVNTERLFREATPAKRAQQKLEKEFAGRDGDIQKLAKQVRDLQALLEKDGVTMAESNDELAAVQERANKVIQQIAEAEKFDLILQDPVVFASGRIDITDKVIKALADK